MKILFLVLNCDAYDENYRKHMAHMLNVFGRLTDGVEASLVYVRGNAKERRPMWEDEYLLRVLAPDTYESIPEKLVRAYQYLLEERSFDFLVKMDDNVMIKEIAPITDYLRVHRPHYAAADVAKMTSTAVSTSHRGKCQNPIIDAATVLLQPVHYAGGPFFALSRAAVEILVRERAYFERALYEDHTTGVVLSSYGVKVTDTQWKAKRYVVWDENAVFG